MSRRLQTIVTPIRIVRQACELRFFAAFATRIAPEHTLARGRVLCYRQKTFIGMFGYKEVAIDERTRQQADSEKWPSPRRLISKSSRRVSHPLLAGYRGERSL